MKQNIVIVQIKGGLGNQMFQYAAGRSLAHRLKLPLKLDISSLESDEDRGKYSLHYFAIKSAIASQEECQFFIKNYDKQGYYYRIKEIFKNKVIPLHKRKFLRQRGYCYAEYFENIQRGCYLEGYWQSENYFLSMGDILKREFVIQDPDRLDFSTKLLNQILDSQSVSIHFRRGDYTEKQHVHGVLTMDYYQKAINLLSHKYKSLKYFIFSDDIEWVQKNWNLTIKPTFVSQHKSGTEIEDFYLMSLCKHHIIANSTFSWWAAWLSKHPKKIVIAPKQWFSKEEMDKRGRIDIIPDRWTVL